MQRARAFLVPAEVLVLGTPLLLVARLRPRRGARAMRQRVRVIVVDQLLHAGRLAGRSTDARLSCKV